MYKAEPWTTAELQTLISAEKHKVVSPNVLPAREMLQQQKSCKNRWGKRSGWNLIMVNIEKQPLTVQGKMEMCTHCQDFHKLFQLLWQEDSEITTRLEELRGLTMPAGTHMAKPLALLPGEVFILHTSPIPVCIHRCLVHPRAGWPRFYGCLRMNLRLGGTFIRRLVLLHPSCYSSKCLLCAWDSGTNTVKQTKCRQSRDHHVFCLRL